MIEHMGQLAVQAEGAEQNRTQQHSHTLTVTPLSSRCFALHRVASRWLEASALDAQGAADRALDADAGPDGQAQDDEPAKELAELLAQRGNTERPQQRRLPPVRAHTPDGIRDHTPARATRNQTTHLLSVQTALLLLTTL